MKHYIIDGNNLFHAIPQARDSNDQRRALVEYLSRVGFFDGKRVSTVVFDGDLDLNSSFKTGAKIRTIFSKNKKADDVICSLVAKDAAKHRDRIVVVTDDHEVANFAKEHRVRAIKNGEFIGLLGEVRCHVCEDLSDDKKAKITEDLRKVWGNRER